MKTYRFIYDKEASLGSALDLAEKAFSSGKAHVERGVTRSNSLEYLSELVSSGRMRLFKDIIERKPESLYRLAKDTNKNQAQVLKEARQLEAMGLIELRETGSARSALKPIPRYDGFEIIVHVVALRTKPRPRKTTRKQLKKAV